MIVSSHEGREPVAPARVERIGACGRGEQATHSGGVGAPPDGQYGLPARSWLTEAVHGSERSRKARPDAEGERRTARRRAPRLRKRACTSRTVAPPGAPSPPFFRREANIANLGRAPRRENDSAWPKQQRFPEDQIELPHE
jgi:hypothetical protein